MKLLLDTNVVSEWASPKPSKAVQEWLNGLDENHTFVSAVTTAEIMRGIELLPQGHRRTRLITWFEGEFLERFGARLLPVDLRTSLKGGSMMAEAQRAGVALDAMDAFIAATASARGLTLATRNTRHFDVLGIPLLNPWEQ